MCFLEATQAAKPPLLKHGPLSVTIVSAPTSPVARSVRDPVQNDVPECAATAFQTAKSSVFCPTSGVGR